MRNDDAPSPSNDSSNPSLADWLDARLTRRQVLKAGVLGALGSLPLSGCAASRGPSSGPLLGFKPVAASFADKLVVPEGYTAGVLIAWGDPIGTAAGAPAFRFDASNSAEEQALQSGMHHDAIEYFSLPAGTESSARALVAMNHEYTDEGLLHPDGVKTWTAAKVAKSQNAHGVAIVEIELRSGRWEVVRPSRYARRITASTPIRLSGPAAGSEYTKTAADPQGTLALGTFNNCAGGRTPWGTYLTCEENFNGYFSHGGPIPPAHRRYGIGARFTHRWHAFDQRFDAARHPNEPNRFGWVVEIDPYDPRSQPVKRTALGRFKHEGAMVTLARDGRVVVYMGDDEAFEYVYKFVSRNRYRPGDRDANRDLLDQGTLYAARFHPDGTGAWLPLRHGESGIDEKNGFRDQADVLVRSRQAADAAGATKMDRPEWIAVHPATGEVYCSLTNNSLRGRDGRPGADPANPRSDNLYGHIIKWSEGGDPAAPAFRWQQFLLAGDRDHPDPARRGSVKGDAFGCPDGLWFDRRGVLWIQTDVSAALMKGADFRRIGNNQMLAADPRTGEVRRFLVGPSGCEVTGVTMAPDGRTMFINIQHPGETPGDISDPSAPRAYGNWPDYREDGRPRSATVAIRREDGGPVGA